MDAQCGDSAVIKSQTTNAMYGDIKATCYHFGFGRSTAYKLLSEKKIRAKKLGAKTLIEFASVDDYFATLPAYSGAS